MKAVQTGIPANSLIAGYLPADYTDSFVCRVKDISKLTPDDLQVAFWTTMPGWIEFLMKTRNVIVRPFGLKGGGNDIRDFENVIRDGKSNGMVSAPAKSPEETVLLLSDSHLCAYMSVRIEPRGGKAGDVYVSTLVRFNNRLGCLYFFFIKPFHKIIVKASIVDTLKRLLS